MRSAIVLCLLLLSSAAVECVRRTAPPPAGSAEHCRLLQTAELQVIIGDAARNGIGGTQYCGVWSLTSRHRPFNAFGNSFGGLIPGEIRGKAPVLEYVDDHTCALSRKADDRYPVDIRAVYRAAEPCYIDHSLTLTDREDTRRRDCDFREVTWCSYMNSPEDSRISFLSDGDWFRYIPPGNGLGSSVAPGYVPDEALEVWPEVEKRRPFNWSRIEERFDEPFYYGRLGGMVLILIFDKPEWVRFYGSPAGGHESLIPGKTSPAWDFEWVIPAAAYEVGREYEFRMRLAYKEYVDDDDVLQEVRKAQEEMGFQKAGG